MKNILLVIFLVLAVFFGIRYFENRASEKDRLEESTALIQKQLRNVGKLVVTEGTFSQVYSYKDSKKFYLDIFSARKKALIIVNAQVSVAYDLSKLKTRIDNETKTLSITHIPKEEISINPHIEYYDVSQDYLNQFEASDYNNIKKRIDASLRKKIAKSSLQSNAKNRLVSELQKIYILTNSMGWTLKYKGETIGTNQALQKLKT